MSNARDKANIPALNFSSTGIDDNATSTAITISSSEFVGINTTSPARLLHITGNDGASGTTSGNSDTQIFIDNNGGNGAIIEFGASNTGAGSILFSDEDASNRGKVQYFHSSNSMVFSTNASEAMRITSTGNVGIGTSSPSSLLHIFSSAPKLIIQDDGTHGTNSAPRLEFKDASSIQGLIDFKDDGTMRIDQIKANPLTFLTNNVERMRIDSSGKVGIGTTSPTYPLQVYKATAGNIVRLGSTRTLDISNSDNGAYLGAIWDRDINSAGGIHTWSIEGNERMRITSSGNVGIGTSSPSQPLDVYGSAQISFSGANTYLYFQSTSNFIGRKTDGNLNIGVAGGQQIITSVGGSERMRINNAGKIFTNQTAQFDDCVTIGGSPFTGDFQIEVSGLNAVNGNAHKSIGMRLSYRGIAGDATGGQNKDVLLYISGLSSWSSVGSIDTGGGTVGISVDSATTTAVTFTVTSPVSNCVGAYVATLFANDNSTMECNG